MSDQIAICHWNDDSSEWSMKAVDFKKLHKYENDQMDIWPPVPELTTGKNWGLGESVYMNQCKIPDDLIPEPVVVEVTATPEPVIQAQPPIESAGLSTSGYLYIIFFGTIALMLLASVISSLRGKRHDH